MLNIEALTLNEYIALMRKWPKGQDAVEGGRWPALRVRAIFKLPGSPPYECYLVGECLQENFTSDKSPYVLAFRAWQRHPKGDTPLPDLVILCGSGSRTETQIPKKELVSIRRYVTDDAGLVQTKLTSDMAPVIGSQVLVGTLQGLPVARGEFSAIYPGNHFLTL